MPTLPPTNYGSILHPAAAAAAKDNNNNDDDKAAEIIQQYWRRYKITKMNNGDTRKFFKDHRGIRESRLGDVSVLARLGLVKNLGTSIEPFNLTKKKPKNENMSSSKKLTTKPPSSSVHDDFSGEDPKPEKKKTTTITASGAGIDYQSLLELMIQVRADMYMNQLTAKHLGTREFCFFIIPQALLTMFSGVLAFF
jgi:hypothetical protein